MSAGRITLLLFLSLTLLPSASAQQESREERQRQLLLGTHVFRRILHDHDLTPLARFEDLVEHPERSILIVLGDLDKLAELSNLLPGGLETYVRAGGAVLLASDRPVTNPVAREQLLSVAGVTIQHETLHNPRNCYRGLSYCPQVWPVSGGSLGLFGDPAQPGQVPFRVFTNAPSKLQQRRHFPGGVRPVAVFAPGTMIEVGRGAMVNDPARTPLFAVGGTLGERRVLVLADHSVFINQMMLPRDTNNVEFTYNLIRWLQGQPASRDRALLIEDGSVQTNFDIPLKSVAIPPEEALKFLFAKRNELLQEAEHKLAELEDRNFFNGKLSDLIDRFGSDRLQLLLLLVSTIVLLLLLLLRLGILARFKYDKKVPVLANEVGRMLPRDPLVVQRQDEMMTRKDVREAAAVLVRRWFSRLGIDPSGPAPEFHAEGNWWTRLRWRRRLQRLWDLAQGRTRRRLKPAELWRLQRELDDWTVQLQRGQWRWNSSTLSALTATALQQ